MSDVDTIPSATIEKAPLFSVKNKKAFRKRKRGKRTYDAFICISKRSAVLVNETMKHHTVIMLDGAEDEKESDDEGKVDLSIIKEIREEQKVGLYDY